MKAFVYKVAALFSLLSLFLCLSSCGKEVCPRQILDGFCTEYGMAGHTFYSDSSESSGDMLGEEMLRAIYAEPPVFREGALFINSRLGSIYECGVFWVPSASDGLSLFGILSERIDFLEKNAGGGESFLLKRGEVYVYGYLPRASEAKRIFDRLL